MQTPQEKSPERQTPSFSAGDTTRALAGEGNLSYEETRVNDSGDSPLARVLARLPGWTQNGKGYSARCPAHDDKTPSLTVTQAADGKVLLHCFVDCKPEAIVTAIGLTLADLFPAKGKPPRIVATYDYHDERGTLLYQSVRYNPKNFKQRRPDGHGGWIWKMQGVRLVLYNLPAVLAAETIFIVEGEKDVETLRAWGLVATCNPMGAGKWRDDYSQSLAGKYLIILPDHDEPGEQHALQVARSVFPVAASDKLVRLPGLPDKGDVTDWRNAGHTKEELLALVEESPLWTEAEHEAPHEANTSREPAWPVLADEALYGLAGDIVHTIDPYTEADKAAVLVTLLAMFGNCVNASAHFSVEYTKHFVRLFVTLVGRTAKGRKGQSLSTLRYIFEKIDLDWSKDRIVLGGLSSGEGVIDAVRDPRLNEEGDVIDRGEPDKRLLLIEEELVSALKVASREGNTLSAILRQAWDRGDLRPLTKNNKMRATGAHISIIAHITQEELLRYLTATEQSNGFGNRFIWLLVRRSKLIPRPVPVPLETLTPLINRLRIAVDFTRKTMLMDRDREAEARWAAVYPSLSEGKPGLFGAIIGRAEVQVMRLACLYALLDCSTLISVVHLEAALALWDYAEESARLIFTDQTGDPAADRLLEALRATPSGLSDKTINTEVFTRNKPATELTRIKLLLVSLGLIYSDIRTDTGGRPETVWKATN